MSNGTDWTDPCARATALRTAYYSLLSGGGGTIQSVRFGDRMVSYGVGDLKTLRSELTLAEAECARKTGLAAKKFAMRFGSRASE